MLEMHFSEKVVCLFKIFINFDSLNTSNFSKAIDYINWNNKDKFRTRVRYIFLTSVQ